MHRRDFLKLAGAASPVAGAPARERPPNVVLILTDDQGYGDLGCHGNKRIRTPHLDRFAGQSAEFTQFYCSPVCSPTRSSIMTGRYNYRTGVLHTSRGAAKMFGDEATLAETLGAAGYRTGIFGKWHLGDNYPMRPTDQGFQEALIHKSGGIGQAPDKPNGYFDPKLWHNDRAVQREGYCTDIFTGAAIRFIENNRRHPFLVYLSTNAPHNPLIVGEDYSGPYERKGLPGDLAKLYGMITNLDDNVGRLLGKISDLGLETNTLVIFLSDNGGTGTGGRQRHTGGLRGTKGSAYEGGIRVPCYFRWPGRFEAGQRIDRIAAHIDLLPTLASLCGAEVPAQVDGLNLAPLLDSDGGDWEDRTLCFQFHRGMTPRRYQNCAVRSQRYKAVSHPGMTQELASDPEPRFELYDLAADPGESRNLAEKLPGEVKKLRRAYDEWFIDVQSSRNFAPGVIHIGSPKENPLHLCRYQDSSYVGGQPRGWPVKIERGGRYEVKINRGDNVGKGKIHVRFGDHAGSKPVDAGGNRGVFKLESGTGSLDIWFQEEGKARVIETSNDTVGDLDIALLE